MIRFHGSSKLNDGVWTLKEAALCVCGEWARVEATFPDDGSDTDRSRLIRSLLREARDRCRECYASHQGEYGLDAIDGTV